MSIKLLGKVTSLPGNFHIYAAKFWRVCALTARHDCVKILTVLKGLQARFYYMWFLYHRLIRADTPDGAPFRRFFPFRLGGRRPAFISKNKNHSKIHRRQVRSSFAGAEMCSDEKRPAGNTAVLSRGLTKYERISSRQNRVCPCQAMVS